MIPLRGATGVRRLGGGTGVDADRLLSRIRDYGAMGRDETGGVTRPGFSEADRIARSRLAREAREAGLDASVDAAGNLLIRRRTSDGEPARGPVLLLGSHLDTVVNGGTLDGAYGVLAALEVLQVLTETGTDTPFEVVVVAFANEEGALYPQPFWGSMALTGRLAELPAEPVDHQGRSLREPLALAGGDLSALGSAVWSPDSLVGYLELHIEQGPVLESGGQTIGVVDAITGRTVLDVEMRGEAGHAGTTPMPLRRDAMSAAARAVVATEELARERELCRVATVGRLEAHPNSPNTIAETVRFTADLRDSDPTRLREAETALRRELDGITAETGVRAEVRPAVRVEPVSTDPGLREAISAGADELGLPWTVLPSGAGHDAQVVADIAPVGMVFVPSTGGLSHVPTEHTDPQDLLAGADVLLRTALWLAEPDRTGEER
ncbi:M20 family metallo-hydrolase [Nocardiopsis sp. NPDC049922]|uniref:M20 family metallo-hydrolase n=1 Tax=Nocardiopsis sp. NPDC049922 TaxID=3155157 RepID=UPI0033C87EA4